MLIIINVRIILQTECNQTVTHPTVNWPNSDFWLENNHSISGHSVCDGISQCGDGKDELICHNDNIHNSSNLTQLKKIHI